MRHELADDQRRSPDLRAPAPVQQRPRHQVTRGACRAGHRGQRGAHDRGPGLAGQRRQRLPATLGEHQVVAVGAATQAPAQPDGRADHGDGRARPLAHLRAHRGQQRGRLGCGEAGDAAQVAQDGAEVVGQRVQDAAMGLLRDLVQRPGDDHDAGVVQRAHLDESELVVTLAAGGGPSAEAVHSQTLSDPSARTRQVGRPAGVRSRARTSNDTPAPGSEVGVMGAATARRRHP